MTADNLSLAGKVALVTGSGRENGIGAGIAVALARNGAAVTINYVSEGSRARAAAVVGKINSAGGRAVAVQADISSPGEGERLVAETLKAFGTNYIDILVNNAGIGSPHSSLTITKDQIESFFGVNVFGAIYLTQAVVPHMPPGGRIINITSVASKMGLDVLPIYGASKAALDSLTYAWAKEFGGDKGITVNSIAPGPVLTDLVPTDDIEKSYSFMLDLTRAQRRIGTMEDIADAVLLMVNEKSRWITGQFISASGGITGH